MATRMESRVEQLERVVDEIQRKQDEIQRKQAESNEKLTGVDTTGKTILEQLNEFRATFNATGNNQIPTRPPQTEPQSEEHDRRRAEETGQNEVPKYRKLELPLFSGEDPLGWIFRIERYFTANALSEPEKLDAGVVSLEGKALTWFQWWETRAPVTSWSDFKKEVIERFHCKQLGDEYEQLFALKQESTMAEYREQFELLSAPLENVRDEILLGAFMNGLKEDIRCDVKLLHPQNLKQAMGFANQVEDRNLVKARLEEKKNRENRTTTGYKWNEYKPGFSKFSNTDMSRSISRVPPTKEVKDKGGGDDSKGTPTRAVSAAVSSASSNSGSTV